jgi:hypothetical protein
MTHFFVTKSRYRWIPQQLEHTRMLRTIEKHVGAKLQKKSSFLLDALTSIIRKVNDACYHESFMAIIVRGGI